MELEQNNKVNKRGINKVAITILVVGVIVSLILCGIGFIKQNLARKTNEERHAKAVEQSQAAVDAANIRLDEIENEIEELEKQYTAKRSEAASLNMSAPDWFSRHTSLTQEASKIHAQINELDIERFRIQNGDYSVYYPLVKPITYLIFYYIAAAVFVLTCISSLACYLVQKKNS